MNIQPINQQTNNNIGFQKLIVKKGSFNVLRNSEYFPDKSYPGYYKNLKSFCKKLVALKKECETNDVYNVVIRPSSKEFQGGMYIESSDGIPQAGFFKPFNDLLELESKKQKKILTDEQDPNLLDRFIRNWKIKRYNKKVEQKEVTMQEFLSSVYKNLQEMVNSADYLKELYNIKKTNK